MSDKIPTAEEYLKKFNLDGDEGTLSKKNLIWMLEDFGKQKAQLHVEAALKAAAEKAEGYNEGSEGNDAFVDKQSILNAYPKTLIK